MDKWTVWDKHYTVEETENGSTRLRCVGVSHKSSRLKIDSIAEMRWWKDRMVDQGFSVSGSYKADPFYHGEVGYTATKGKMVRTCSLVGF
jgi:hypothetical protein